MKALLFAGIGQGFYCALLFLVALFLILLILIQRGRGGGLSGAFGGMGGQSAFGSKAGDTFTKITIIAATVWIVLCLIGVKFLGQGASVLVDSPDAVLSGPPVDQSSSDLSLDLEGSTNGAAADDVSAEATGADFAPATSPAAPPAVAPSESAAPAEGPSSDGPSSDGPSSGSDDN